MLVKIGNALGYAFSVLIYHELVFDHYFLLA